MIRLADFFPMILVTAVAALGLSLPLARLARAAGFLDIPGSAPHKQHETAVPLAGGPVVALAIALAYLVLRPGMDGAVAGILLGGMFVLLTGMLDDRLHLRPSQKLIGQLVAAGLLMAFGVQVRITRLPPVDLTLTLLWVVGMVNAFNFVDSKDGLALGLAGIAASFFMLVTIDSAQPLLAMLSAAILGACIGTYFLNASPARMFLGDSGAQLLGFLLAGVGIAYIPAQAGLPQGVTWFLPILVLGVPIFDMMLVVISRVRARQPIYRAGLDHTYHRLVSLGLDSTRSVLAMQIAAIVLGLAAFMALDTTVLAANLIFGVAVLGGIGALVVLLRRAGQPGG